MRNYAHNSMNFSRLQTKWSLTTSKLNTLWKSGERAVDDRRNISQLEEEYKKTSHWLSYWKKGRARDTSTEQGLGWSFWEKQRSSRIDRKHWSCEQAEGKKWSTNNFSEIRLLLREIRTSKKYTTYKGLAHWSTQRFISRCKDELHSSRTLRNVGSGHFF